MSVDGARGTLEEKDSVALLFSSFFSYQLLMRQPAHSPQHILAAPPLCATSQEVWQVPQRARPLASVCLVIPANFSAPRAWAAFSAVRSGWQLWGEYFPNLFLLWGLCLSPKDSGYCLYLCILSGLCAVNPFSLLKNSLFFFYCNYCVVSVSWLNPD